MVLPTHPSRHWQADRMSGSRPPTGDPIYEPRHPLDICTMMDQYCGISLNHFIMAGISKDGKLMTFSGPRENSNPMVLQRYIDVEGYNNWYNTGTMLPTPSPPTYEENYLNHGDTARHQMNSMYGGRRQYDHRRRMQPAYDFDEDEGYRSRKRPRGAVTPNRRHLGADAGPAVQVVHAKRGIKIGNKEEVWKLYDSRFKTMQQTACKTIAKAWIKLIAPKKQSHYPYTGQDAKAPGWWPQPWGTARDEKVRHKEPDHLYKAERVHLLNHILNMVTEPNHSQHKDIGKLSVNVSKLEEATFEALSSWFADVDHPNNAKKRPCLKEIFRVAKYQERFKNGEIDGEAEVLVTADDKVPVDWLDAEEDDPPQEDDDHQPTPTSSPKPEHTLPTIAVPEQGPATSLQGGSSFAMAELPVRGHPYSQSSLMHSDLTATGGPSNFVENSTLSVNNQPTMPSTHGMSLPEAYSDPHASSRRPSLYTSTAEYGTSSGPGLYQTWQQSNAPTASPVYSFQQQHPQQHPHPHSSGSYVEQQPVALGQTPQYLEAPTFDPMHSGPPPSLYRPTNVSQGPVNPHATHTFPNYLNTHSSGMKLDPLGRGHQHEDNDNKRWN